ncbi:molybdate ABC transporter substrate-binding protein [Mycobacterium sp. ACS4331]|uniref:molybdate ABC transporter substrate-binding protein n=1 Tax=Mycobacterium sp. ACS4331 TaxID=1834121 RepID=UPI000A97D4AB|nr:molybdate ABC transporter substrate-binding protein [Mycobacterium sp. ACS4331]
MKAPAALVPLTLALLVAGCTSSQEDSSSIIVFAAASLKSTFTELGSRFEQDHPGTTVTFNFAGSSDLATQLNQGAPADVFASADTDNMTRAADRVSGEPVDFATNTLTIVTAPGNPKGIATFADLTRPGIQVVVCAPQVPCGAATEKVEKATGVALSPVSEESAVTDVLGKVTSGQADAGLVYVTDARGAGDKVTALAFPAAADAVNTYPIAVLKDSANPEAAAAFVDLVTGPVGRAALAAAGFAEP